MCFVEKEAERKSKQRLERTCVYVCLVRRQQQKKNDKKKKMKEIYESA